MLAGVRGIAFTRFTSADVVRHPLVQKHRRRLRAPRSAQARASARDAGASRARGAARAHACSPRRAAAALPRRATLRRWARAALERDLAVTLRFVGAREGRALNARYRGRDYATNVLTFVYDDVAPLGRRHRAVRAGVAREARAQGKTLRAHCAHLIVHGMLHLQGYDHERDADADAMEARETALLARLGYPRSRTPPPAA